MKWNKTIILVALAAIAVAAANIKGTEARAGFERNWYGPVPDSLDSAGSTDSSSAPRPADSLACADSTCLTDSLKGLQLRDSMTAGDSTAADSSLIYAPPVDSALLMRDTLGIPMRDSIGRFIDTLGRSIDSLGRPLDSLGMPILYQKRVPSKAELRMYRRDSIKAVKDSIIQNTPRILDTYAVPDSLFYKRILVWTHDPYFNNIELQKLDTSFNYHYHDMPFMKDDVDGIYLGVAGSPVLRMNYFKRTEDEDARFFDPYLPYTYTPDNLPQYNTKTPYVELQYSGTLLSNREKEEANIKILATQNITPEANIMLEYHRFGGNGMLRNESTDNRTAVIAGNYLGKKYLMHAGYIFNRTKRTENGGLRESTWIRDTLVDPREIDIWLTDAYSETRKNTVFIDQSVRIPFNFINKMREKRRMKKEAAAADSLAGFPSDSLAGFPSDSLAGFPSDSLAGFPSDSLAGFPSDSLAGLQQDSVSRQGQLPAPASAATASAAAGPAARSAAADTASAQEDSTAFASDENITTAFIGMSNEYSAYRRRYTDNISASDEYGRSFYNNAFYLNPTTTNDSMRVANFDNKIYLRLQPWAEDAILSKLDAGVGYKLQQFYLFEESDYVSGPSSTTFHTFYAYAGAQGSYKKYLGWDAFAKYNFAGYANNDFLVKANAKFSFYPFKDGSPISLRASFSQELKEPWFYEQNYTSNHYRWRNSFSKESETRIEGYLDIPKYKLQAFFGYSLLANGIYYDTLGIVRQSGSPVSVMSAYLRKDFKVWKLHFDNKVLFQMSSDQTVMPLPMLSLNLRYYIQFPVVKNVMEIQAGAEGTFSTAWYAPAYNPALGVFQNQVKEKIGGKDPYINVFINIQWKRACIFIKLRNVGENKRGSDYFSTYGYIRPPMTLDFGIFWPFYTLPDKHQRVEYER